jgi:hypothetical protein
MNDQLPLTPGAHSLLDYVSWTNRGLSDTPAWKLAYLGGYIGVAASLALPAEHPYSQSGLIPSADASVSSTKHGEGEDPTGGLSSGTMLL